MSCDYHALTHPGIQSLHPYVPGKSIDALAAEKGLTDIIKMASNENPLGCSELAQKALAAMTPHQLALYPSPLHHPLYTHLASHLGINTDQLMLSNGSDYIFWFVLTVFALNQKKYMLTHEYAFITYRIQAQIMGIPILTTPEKPDYSVDIEAMIQSCRDNDVAVILLANPNNPTGLSIPNEAVRKLVAEVPASTIVVLDEAYYEYSDSTTQRYTLELQQQFPNLVLTRTFSKIYGLAALRLGYAIANPDIIALLLRVQLPFTVNQAALVAAHAALDDPAFIQNALACNREGMAQLSTGLTALQLEQLPSQANFITFDCGTDSAPIYEHLLEKGIIVRPLRPYGLPNHLRVSIGTTEQNARFLAALSTLL